jgi:hypothetical protein
VVEKVRNNRYLGVDEDDVEMLRTRSAGQGVVIEDMFPPSYYVKSFNRIFNNIAADNNVVYRLLSVENVDDGWIIGVKDAQNDTWEIDPVEYTGAGLDECLAEIISNQPVSEQVQNNDGDVNLHKRAVAEHIHDRLKRGDAPEDNLNEFNSLLGNVGSTLGL